MKIFISWDIDGTLLRFHQNTSYHQEVFKLALSEIFKPCGLPVEVLECNIYGWMDRMIIKKCIEKLGFQASEENVTKVLNRADELFKENFDSIPEVCPGIEKVLKTLYDDPDVVIGIASGNTEEIAWKKLRQAGLDKYFKGHIGGYGGYVEIRKDALLMSRKKAEEFAGCKFDKVFHVGDMPSDVEAAHGANAVAVAVKTGHAEIYNYPPPCHVFENLDVSYDQFMELLKKMVLLYLEIV